MLVLALAGFGTACAHHGTGGPGQPVAKFPTRARLEEIAAQPVAPIAQEPVYRATEWRAPGPAAETAAPTAETAAPTAETAAPAGEAVTTSVPAVEERWASLFKETMAARGDVTVNAALGCAAKEFARLYVEHGALPDRRLQEFIEGACGAGTPFAVPAFTSGSVPDTTSDDDLFSTWSGQLRNELAKMVPDGRRSAGFGLVRANGKVAAVVVSGQRVIDGVKTPIVANAKGYAVLQGTVEEPVKYVEGFVNQGALEARECIRDQSISLPRFRMWCPVAPGDAFAWADVEVVEPDRILGRVVGRYLLRASADAELTYQAQTTSAKVANPAQLRQQLLAGINAMRGNAGAAPLTLAEKQSMANERLAPHFFAKADSENGALQDSILLGLVAGWDVKGMIRNGDFFSSIVVSGNDANDLLLAMFDHPSARHVLMNRDARQIAIGPVLLPNGGGMAAVVTTYAFFDSNDHRADEAAFFRRIDAARRARGLPPPTAVDATKLQKAITEIQNGTNPDEALRRAAQGMVRRGYSLLLQTTDLKRMPLPPEVLRPGPLNLALAITHYRAPGGAWGQYVIMFVVAE